MAVPAPSRLDRVITFLRRDFAEWFIGSWALAIGWSIIAWIFSRLIVMDGHFSRGLGEGSGVDPGLFQQTGWAYRFFAASFLVIAYKLAKSKLLWSAWAFRLLGAFCTCIVILHAVGFGLKALESKRAGAMAIVETHVVAAQSNADVIAALNTQRGKLVSELKEKTDPLDKEIYSLDHDGKRNEELSTTQKKRRAALQDAAQPKIDELDKAILTATTSGGQARTAAVSETIKAEKWAPLFVGLAQLATWNQHPSDWAIYLAGVIFTVFWVLLGDMICIVGPECLYKLHLKDASNVRVTLHPDTAEDLIRRAEELERRVANLSEGARKGKKTKEKNENVKTNVRAIEDLRSKVDQSTTPLHEDAGDDVTTPSQLETSTEPDPTEPDGEDEANDEQTPRQAAE